MLEHLYVEDSSIKARREEIDIKVARIQEYLKKEDLNALYMSRQCNFYWITAGSTNTVTVCTEDGVAAIIITRDGDRYCITDEVEAAKMKEEQLVEELGFKLISQAWYEKKNLQYVEEFAGDQSKVGSDVVYGGMKFVHSDINKLRYSLTKNEIGRYQTLGDNMSKGLEAALATVKPGMSENEIAGIVARHLWPMGIEQTLFLVASDERILKHRHATPTAKKLEKFLMVSCNGRYKGLITTTTRMVHFGQAPESLLKQYEINCIIENRMIAATKPGVDDLVPHMVGKKAYEEFGYGDMYFKHHQGGAQGYYNRDYLVSEGMHMVTLENQCYCYNPAISGTKTEDAFVATKEGPVMITKPSSFPKIVQEVDGIVFERPGILVI